MAKKNWISIPQDEHNIINTQQITWETSSSEEEFSALQWKNEGKSSKPNLKCSPIVPLFNQPNISIESPILKLRCCSSNDVSPKLSQKNSLHNRMPSPIIEKCRLRLKKQKKRKEPLKERADHSPDLFKFDSTQDIENESPAFDEVHSQAAVKIEPFPSQFGSSVEEDNIKDGSNFFLYYQPPKRKKTYKKGSVACQLHKILKIKKSRVKIWQHEKLKNIHDNFFQNDDDDDIVRFKVNSFWTNYGVRLLECVIFNESSLKEGDMFLLSLGVSQILHIEFNNSDVYELYPPYSRDNIMYNNVMIPYYYSGSKMCKLS